MWRGLVQMSRMVGSSMEPEPGACPFSWQEGTSAGSQVRERGAVGLRCAGIVVEVSGMGLISSSCLLDDGETRDTVERIGLDFKPGIGDLLTAAGTDSVRMGMERRKRLLNPAKLVDGEHFHGQRDTNLMLGGGLVDWVGEEFRFCGDLM